MKRILLVILVLVLGVQSKADELINGSFSKLGLNFAYLAHNAGKSHIDSLHIALHYDSYSTLCGLPSGYSHFCKR